MASEIRRSKSEALIVACAARSSVARSSDVWFSVTAKVAAVRDRFVGRPRDTDADACAEDTDAEDAEGAAVDANTDADVETCRARGSCVRGERFDVAPEAVTAAVLAMLT